MADDPDPEALEARLYEAMAHVRRGLVGVSGGLGAGHLRPVSLAVDPPFGPVRLEAPAGSGLYGALGGGAPAVLGVVDAAGGLTASLVGALFQAGRGGAGEDGERLRFEPREAELWLAGAGPYVIELSAERGGDEPASGHRPFTLI